MRIPRPYLRSQTGSWYVQIGKRQIRLGPDKDAAFLKYHEIMAGRGLAESKFSKLAQLLEAYLDWLASNRSQGTYKKARHYLSLFVQRLGPAFPLCSVDGLQVTQWVESNENWSPTTGHDAVSTV